MKSQKWDFMYVQVLVINIHRIFITNSFVSETRMNLYQKVNKNVKKFNLLEQSNAESLYMKKNPKVLYVGGANASNTLDEGRGLTSGKPFADITNAIRWMTGNYCNRDACYIRVQGDTEMPTNLIGFNAHNISGIHVSSYPSDQRYTIKSTVSIKFFSGEIVFENLRFDFDITEIQPAFHTNGSYYGTSPVLRMTNCEIIGKAAVNIQAYTNSFVSVSNLTGDLEGKRYSCNFGSVIMVNRKGPNAIPGTIDGTCDESSFYI